jgi:hypothetical protein
MTEHYRQPYRSVASRHDRLRAPLQRWADTSWAAA